FFFFQAEDGIRDGHVTGVQTCALPILEVPAMNRDSRNMAGTSTEVEWRALRWLNEQRAETCANRLRLGDKCRESRANCDEPAGRSGESRVGKEGRWRRGGGGGERRR